MDWQGTSLRVTAGPAAGKLIVVAGHYPRLPLPGARAAGPDRPGATRVGWARFEVPARMVPLLDTRRGSISFYPAVLEPGIEHIAEIRLWHPANEQGARAAQVVFAG